MSIVLCTDNPQPGHLRVYYINKNIYGVESEVNIGQ